MNRSLYLLGIFTFVISPHIASAQQNIPLPAIVQQQIDDETVLVARIDLTGSGISAVSNFLAGLPDPWGLFGDRATNCDRALQKLSTLKVGEVFAIVATHHLPANGATIVVPSNGTEAERAAIADALKSIWPNDVRIVPAGIVVGETAARQAPADTKRPVRSEYSIALGSAKGAQVQVAVSLGTDARRALRELLPVIPQEFGGGSILPVVDGWQWLALGLTASPKLDLQFVIQAKDEPSAQALERTIVSLLKSATENGNIKAVLPNTRELVALLTPARNADRIVLSLTEANGGAKKLIDEVASPLLGQMEKDSRRTRTINNLKQLMLEMHNYHDTYKAFPPQATRSPDGKKLLSWRVLLLPFVGEGPLYKEFHLDEPWDSEHNVKLVTRMPDVFASLNITREQRMKGMTTYLGPIAEKTLFGTPEGIPIKKITDGTSNTIAIVDANTDRAVPWTKPADLDVDLKQPLMGLKGQSGGMFRAAFCDGSVRGIAETIDPETLRRLFQINDGEAIGDF